MHFRSLLATVILLCISTSVAHHDHVVKRAAAATQYTIVTTQVTSTSTTNVGFTVNQEVFPGVSTLIPGSLTITFNGPGYIYLETLTSSVTIFTTNIRTRVPVTSTAQVSIPTTPTAPTKATGTSNTASTSVSSTKATTSASIPASSINSASTKSPTSSSSTSSAPATSSTSSSGTMCAWTLDGNINPKYTIANNVYTTGDYIQCPKQCSSNSSCKSFTYFTSSGRYGCSLFNASIATLLQVGPQTKDPVDGSTSSSSAIYYDAACTATPPDGTNCGYFANSLTATGTKAFIARESPKGTGYTPCYHGCQTTKNCKSYLAEGTSTDSSGNSISTCSYYSASVADTFVAGGWKSVAFDAACVPGLYGS